MKKKVPQDNVIVKGEVPFGYCEIHQQHFTLGSGCPKCLTNKKPKTKN